MRSGTRFISELVEQRTAAARLFEKARQLVERDGAEIRGMRQSGQVVPVRLQQRYDAAVAEKCQWRKGLDDLDVLIAKGGDR